MVDVITNCYDPAAERPRLTVEKARLFSPEAEWTYSHHASITHFNNRYHAIWSNSRQDEDAPGQRIMTCSSKDFKTWTEPIPLADTIMGRQSECVLTAAGFHQYDGKLTAYYGQYEYVYDSLVEGNRTPGNTSHMDINLWALSTHDGENWTAPVSLGLPIIPNHGPQPTASGRLIISGNIMYPYTDDPSGLTDWNMTGVYPPDADPIADDSGWFGKVAAMQNWDFKVCEGSFYQTDDGSLHMLLRSYEKKLRHSISADDGQTWSTPELTEFTDNCTKFHLGRLPDGRFYNVSCPDPDSDPRRFPLVLSLSEDGAAFDRALILTDEMYEMKREGMHKGGIYGYPHSLIHDGFMYVIYSLRKEAIEVLRVPISAL